MASTRKLENRKCLFLIPGVNELSLRFGSIFRVTCEGFETPPHPAWGKAVSVLSVTTTINSGAQRERCCREAEKESVQAGQDRWGAEGGEGTVNLKRKL